MFLIGSPPRWICKIFPAEFRKRSTWNVRVRVWALLVVWVRGRSFVFSFMSQGRPLNRCEHFHQRAGDKYDPCRDSIKVQRKTKRRKCHRDIVTLCTLCASERVQTAACEWERQLQMRVRCTPLSLTLSLLSLPPQMSSYKPGKKKFRTHQHWHVFLFSLKSFPFVFHANDSSCDGGRCSGGSFHTGLCQSCTCRRKRADWTKN